MMGEPPSSELLYSWIRGNPKVAWAPKGTGRTVEQLCQAVWVAVRLDGWQDWGNDIVVIPEFGIRMGVGSTAGLHLPFRLKLSSPYRIAYVNKYRW